MNEAADPSKEQPRPSGRAWLAVVAAAIVIAGGIIVSLSLVAAGPESPDCKSFGEEHIRSRVNEYLESWWDDTDQTGDDIEMTLYRLDSDRLQSGESACLAQIEWPDSDQFFFSDVVVCMTDDDQFIRLSTQSILSERAYDEMVQDCLMVLRGFDLAAT